MPLAQELDEEEEKDKGEDTPADGCAQNDAQWEVVRGRGLPVPVRYASDAGKGTAGQGMRRTRDVSRLWVIGGRARARYSSD